MRFWPGKSISEPGGFWAFSPWLLFPANFFAHTPSPSPSGLLGFSHWNIWLWRSSSNIGTSVFSCRSIFEVYTSRALTFTFRGYINQASDATPNYYTNKEWKLLRISYFFSLSLHTHSITLTSHHHSKLWEVLVVIAAFLHSPEFNMP